MSLAAEGGSVEEEAFALSSAWGIREINSSGGVGRAEKGRKSLGRLQETSCGLVCCSPEHV